MPVAQDGCYGCASLLGHNNFGWTGVSFIFCLFNLSTALLTPFRSPPPRPSFLKPQADPRATSSYPARAGTFPTLTPRRAARPPTVRGSLHYGAPCLEKGRARARASTLRGHKGAKAGERRRQC